MASKQRRPGQPVFCPFCSAKDLAQPVLAPMKICFVAGGCSTPNQQPYNEPHYDWKCTRCSYSELHDHEDK